jgi:6-phosphofructokinase 1
MLEVMGRNCGDIALYASICGGAEFCLIPEVSYDINQIASTIKENVKNGKTSNMIIVAEGVADKEKLPAKLKELSGVDFKYTNFGHIIRGGAPTMADRILATRMAVKAVEVIKEKKTNRVIGIKDNQIFDANITDALSLPRKLNEELYRVAGILAK